MSVTLIINSKKKNYGDRLVTPDSIYLKCVEIWNTFCTLDVCAEKKSAKCDHYLSKKDKGLLRVWNPKNKTACWLNPPHSETKLWIEKAFHNWKYYDTSIIGIIPINCLCSNYALQYLLPHASYQPLTGRIKFLDPDTLKPSKYNSVNG